MNRKLVRLAVTTAAIMFLVVQMGALVTNTGSEDGCGQSWPLCKGTFMPEWDYPALIEFSHRAVSALAGLLSLILAYAVLRTRTPSRAVRGMALAGFLLVCLQGALGAAAVVWPQPDTVMALHFGISLLCFSTVLLTAAMLQQEGRAAGSLSAAPFPGPMRRWIWTAAGFTYVVLYLGAYVRHVGASMACRGWPLCNGALVPPLYGPVGANFAHRVGAALAVVMVVRLAVMARQYQMPTVLRRTADLALALILAQVASGALFPLGYLNVATQMLHSILITAFWGALSLLWLEAVRPSSTAGMPAGPSQVLR